ncbi:MAG: hypothetical protein IKH04_00450 [Kiritimatiellae bacterium]|nr:hypothetical protein [Kiritimatiellia bacterium]
MSEFQSRPEHSVGHAKWLWRFDGRKTDWRLDVRDGGRRRRPDSDLDDDRLNHYLRIGVIHSDIEEEKERDVPIDGRATVVKWLACLAAVWVVFRFVRF